MTPYILPVVFTVVVWWLTTGVVLYAMNLRPRTYRWSMLVATAVLAGALYGLVWSSGTATVTGAYVAFLCGLLVWGWVEMSYCTGFVTGPRPEACPAGVTRWRRFVLALQASLYHELAVLGFLGIVVALTWGMPNQVGTWTFVVLWLMRWSAKLNIFLGVPQLNIQFLPDHLRYVESFIVKRRMNGLFPVSMVISVIVAVLVLARAVGDDALPFDVAASFLIGTLIILGTLEHAFLVVPLPDAALWTWALPSRSRDAGRRDGAGPPAPKRSSSDDLGNPSGDLLSALETVPACGSSCSPSAPSNRGR